MNSCKKILLPGLALLMVMLLGCSSTPNKGPVSDEKIKALVDTYVNTAGIYLQRGQLEFAKEKIDKAMELDADSANANNIMALYQWRVKQIDEADKYFRKAIDVAPSNPESLNNYAVFLCEKGEVESAIKYYDRAVAVPLYSSKIQAYTNAGKCLLKKKEMPRAEKYFTEALKMNPYYPDAALEMAKISASKGRLPSAKKYIGDYFVKGRKTGETVYLAMRIEETMGNKREASRFAQLLISNFPDSREAIWVKNRHRKKR